MYKTFLESVDKKGVMASQGRPLDSMGCTNCYLRVGKYPYTSLDKDYAKMYQANQDKVIGWFATKNNMAVGYTVQELSEFDKKEFTGKGVFRIYSNTGTSIVKINLQKGKVYFLDNEHYLETDKIKWLSPMSYHRLFVDDTPQAMRGWQGMV